MEQKVNMIMRYIATDDKKRKGELKKAILEALASEDETTIAKPKVDLVDDMIYDILKNVGMPPHLVGYKYVVTAIHLCVQDPTYLEQITKRLYPDIATEYNTIPSRVERAMRHAIVTAFDRGDISYITEHFGYTISARKGKLANSEFVASCANDIRRALKR
jgi:two-component system response regulator (stage 0 sporulation protein A)